MTKEYEKSDLLKAPMTLRIARLSTFSALCVVGSFIHPPSPIGSVAFDSLSGFFAALYFGALDGALICGIGHIVTSLISGFPLGILHLPIAFSMALAGGAVGVVNKTNKKWGFIPATIAGIVINTGAFVIIIPTYGLEAALVFVPFLMLAASLNAIIAALIYISVRRRIKTP